MNDCKMQQMSITLERKHLRKDTQNGICVSPLHSQRKKRRKIIRRLQKTTVFSMKLFVSLFIAWLLSLYLKPLAYAERGYHAYGGETLLVIATFFTMMYVLSLRPKTRRRKYE